MITMKKPTSFIAGIGLAWAALGTFAIGQERQKFDPAEYRQKLMKLSNQEQSDMVRLAFEQRDVETLVAGVEAEAA